MQSISRLALIGRRCTSAACFLAIALGVANVGAAEPQKIGFVNAVSVLDRAPQAALALAGLEKEFKPRDNELLEFRWLWLPQKFKSGNVRSMVYSGD